MILIVVRDIRDIINVESNAKLLVENFVWLYLDARLIHNGIEEGSMY